MSSPSWWQRLVGAPKRATADDSLVTALRTWRAARQPALVRLERARAQVRAALQHTRAEIHGIQTGQIAAPVKVASEAAALIGDDRLGGGAYLESLVRREEGLEALHRQLDAQYNQARAEVELLKEARVRTQRLNGLLDRCRTAYEDSQGIVLHAPQPVQEAFEVAVCSVHAREGRVLQQWLDIIHKQMARDGPLASGPQPSMVLECVQYLARLIVSQHQLSSHMMQVYVCTNRLIIARLEPALWLDAVRRNAPRDTRLLVQQRMLRDLPPTQLGVDPRFLPTTRRPSSASAIDDDRTSTVESGPSPLAAATVLSDFCYLAVPIDMLLCLYRAVGMMHSAAAEMAQLSQKSIGAEELLPLLVWTVVHTPMPHAFAAIEYVKALTTKEHSSSELGYYLACLEAACEYVLDATASGSPAPSGIDPMQSTGSGVASGSSAGFSSSSSSSSSSNAVSSSHGDLDSSCGGCSGGCIGNCSGDCSGDCSGGDGGLRSFGRQGSPSTTSSSHVGCDPARPARLPPAHGSAGSPGLLSPCSSPSSASPMFVRSDEAERADLANLLQHEWVVDDIVGALAL